MSKIKGLEVDFKKVDPANINRPGDKSKYMLEFGNLTKSRYGIRDTFGIRMDVEIKQKINEFLRNHDEKGTEVFERFIEEYWPLFVKKEFRG